MSFFAVVLLSGLVTNCYAQAVSSTDLIKDAKGYDGQTVVYEGEVIGDVMCRGDFCWVNVNDGGAAIGVWMPEELTRVITYRGSYKEEGDWLKIEGIFNRACPEHAGDLDIHAKDVWIVKKGKPIIESPDLKKRNLGIVLLGVLCIVLILSRSKAS